MADPVTELDLTIVVNLHTEGLLAHRTLRSVARAASVAHARGLGTETLVVVDSPDAATRQYLARVDIICDRLIEVDSQDLSVARNMGTAEARGRYIAFVDGDDICSPTWFTEAMRYAVERSQFDVIHPEYLVTFGTQQVLSRHFDSVSSAYVKSDIVERNSWSAHVLTTREAATIVPFTASPSRAGFYEDWHWLADIMAAGGEVRIAPQTCVFIRRREGSLLTERGRALLMPTQLFSGLELRAVDDSVQSLSATAVNKPSKTRVSDASVSWSRRMAAVTQSRGRRFALRHPEVAPLIRRGRQVVQRLDFIGSRTPDIVLDQARQVHDLEPVLFPDSKLRHSQPYDPSPVGGLGPMLMSLLGLIPAGTTHVLAVPWLKQGGADLEAINYARALGDLGQGVVVIGTEDTDSPLAVRLPASARWIPFGRIASSLSLEQKEFLFSSVLIQSGVTRLHILNSRLAYTSVARYGQSLTSYMRVYVSIFCEELSVEGQLRGYAFEELPEILPWLAGLFADNQRILSLISETYAVDTAIQAVHYQPIDPSGRRPAQASQNELRVLWAGRLDRQKRPDILLKIAMAARHLPIRFSVYGYELLDPVVRSSDLAGPNLEFRGKYDSFASLPLEEFGVLLMTSEYEGLPNVLLEAQSAGLVAVSSAVGGVPELIDNGRTGLLVERFDDVERYVEVLAGLLADPDRASRLAESATRRLATRHSPEAFIDQLRGFPGYVN